SQPVSKPLCVGNGIRDDLGKQCPCVSVVVVKRALRKPGDYRDLVHGRSHVTILQEQRPRCLHRCQTRSTDPGVLGTGLRCCTHWCNNMLTSAEDQEGEKFRSLSRSAWPKRSSGVACW